MAAQSRPQAETSGADLPLRLTTYLGQRAPQVVAEWQAHPAAVLIPLYRDSGEWKVLFTRRTDSVDAHPGQVSFPGGRLEPSDRDARQGALREAQEEIGIRPEDVSILGVLDSLLTVTQFLVSPVVATIPWPYPLTLNSDEVASAFGVPVSWLADPVHVEARERPVPMLGRSPIVYYFRPFEGEVIWGVTARITLQLIQALRESAP
ncbi:MAG: CoA pyrophosphatase [Anaerolineales bacterium]